MRERIELRECSSQDGYDILEMLHEIGPGESGFQNNAYNTKKEDFKDLIYRSYDSDGRIWINALPGRILATCFTGFEMDVLPGLK